MDNMKILIAVIFVCIIFSIFTVKYVLMRKKKNKYKKMIEDLDYQKNELDTSPVGPELVKMKEYISNDKLEVMYNSWKDRLDDIKDTQIPKITDMLIEAEYFLSKKDYKSTMYKIAKLEMEIYKVRTSSEFLLDEIKGVTNSEKINRGSVTKEKAEYRKLYEKFLETRGEFGDYEKIVESQFNDIAKRFEDFETLMENNEVTDIPKILKVISDMIKHMEVIIEELPSIVLIGESLLPKKIKDIEKQYDKMKKDGYLLDYLNVPHNISESKKKIAEILERAKVLNIEDSLFDLKVLSDYYENLFTEFEKEKVVKGDYEDALITFKNKLNKTNKVVSEIFEQMDYLKKMYNLSSSDIENFDSVKDEVEVINKEYDKLIKSMDKKNFSYSKLIDKIDDLFQKMASTESKLDSSLNKLGGMHDDEVRAREQLVEVKDLLRKSQAEIRTYNLPFMPDSYYVELKEARDAMREIVKELDKKPITIDTLNTRVDTARDLALKLYGKTRELMKTAMFAEMAIVYGNRYRSREKDLDRNLRYSESLFYKGEYKKSLELTINSLNRIEPGIYEKLLVLSEKREN